MGWFFRKSFRLLPGIRVNLSKSGPRVSVGVPGARASINMQGKARIYGGKGPLRYQKTVSLSPSVGGGHWMGFATLLKQLFQKKA